MSKKLFLGALISVCTSPLFAQFSNSDVQFWVGSGTDSTILVVDFNDGTSDSSYAWGYAYSGAETGEDLLNAISTADENFSVAIAGGFLNDVTYGSHAGIGGQPDYWSTWSGSDTINIIMNAGISTPLVNGEWFALSYTDFSPALVPGIPIPAFNPSAFSFADVDQWYGSGSDSAAFFIDFQFSGDSGLVIFGYLFTDSVLASQILTDLDQALPGLSVNAGAFLNDITYNSWMGIGASPNFWSTWSANNVGNWYLNSGISTYVKAQELFACSYTDFSPALRPRVPNTSSGLSIIEAPINVVSVYPNPAQNFVNISATQATALEVWDAQGQIIKSFKPAQKHLIDVSNWSKGIYFLRSSAGSKRLYVK